MGLRFTSIAQILKNCSNNLHCSPNYGWILVPSCFLLVGNYQYIWEHISVSEWAVCMQPSTLKSRFVSLAAYSVLHTKPTIPWIFDHGKSQGWSWETIIILCRRNTWHSGRPVEYNEVHITCSAVAECITGMLKQSPDRSRVILQFSLVRISRCWYWIPHNILNGVFTQRFLRSIPIPLNLEAQKFDHKI